jgi:hypothetical protein
MTKPFRWLALTLVLAGCGGDSGTGGDGGEPPPGGGNTYFAAPVNLTNNAGYSNMSAVAMSGTGATATVLVAWRDDVSGTAQVWLKRSTDGGATFGTPINLSASNGGTILPSVRPTMIISGTGATALVLVAWHGQTTNSEIFVVRSTNGGASFSTPVNRSNNTGSSGWPSLAVSGTGVDAIVLLTWMGQPGNVTGEWSDILVMRSNDGGASFGTLVNVSTKPAGGTSVGHPAVAITGTGAAATAVIAWEDDRSGHYDVWRVRSTDGGASFSAPANLSNNATNAFRASVVAAGSGATATILVGWDGDNASGRDAIYLKRSTDGGATFGTVIPISNHATGYSYDPSIGITGVGDATSSAIIAYEYNADIWMARSTNGGTSFGAPVRLSNNSSFTITPSVAMTGLGATETAMLSWTDDVADQIDVFLSRSK